MRFRRGGVVICAIFVIALLLPWAVPSSAGTLENRRTVAFPELSLPALLDSRTYEQIGLALTDRIGLRKEIIPRVGRLSTVLGVSLNSNIHVGHDLELFTTEDFTLPCQFMDRFHAAAVKARLERWNKVAAAHGKEVLYGIAPDKAAIQRADLGPQGSALMRCSDSVRKEIQSAWGPDGDDIMLLLWDDLAQVEEQKPRLSYQNGDAHWTQVGAGVMLDRLVNHISGGAIDPDEELEPTGEWRRPGDLYTQLGFTHEDLIPVVEIERPGVRTDKSLIRTPTLPHNRRYTSTSSDVPLLPGKTIVVHDSFANALEPMLEGYFEEVTFIHWEDYPPAVRRGELPDFDRIIFESVERGFARRIVEDLPDPELEAGLLAALRS